jgi:hypothetical protein
MYLVVRLEEGDHVWLARQHRMRSDAAQESLQLTTTILEELGAEFV